MSQSAYPRYPLEVPEAIAKERAAVPEVVTTDNPEAAKKGEETAVTEPADAALNRTQSAEVR